MYIFKPSVLQMLIFINFHIKNNNQIKKHQNRYKPYQLYLFIVSKGKNAK